MIIYMESTLNLIVQRQGAQIVNQMVQASKIKESKNTKYIILN